MIVEYHRPNTIEEALQLLSRSDPVAVPMGGGTVLNGPSPEPVAVVNLQNLGLNTMDRRGSFLHIGAAVTLQNLIEASELQPVLLESIRLEANYNLRQVATVAGTLVATDGRSPLTSTLLALDVSLTLLPGDEEMDLGDLLQIRDERLRGRLITKTMLNLKVDLAYQYFAHTPADRPIVCVAVARWPSGRLRVVIGGFGDTPRLALDGPKSGGVSEAVRSVCATGADQWATAEYRMDLAATLAQRALQSM